MKAPNLSAWLILTHQEHHLSNELWRREGNGLEFFLPFLQWETPYPTRKNNLTFLKWFLGDIFYTSAEDLKMPHGLMTIHDKEVKLTAYIASVRLKGKEVETLKF